MERAIATTTGNQVANLAEVMEQAKAYISKAKADNTVKAYRSDWADFTTWCAVNGATALPASPDTVVVYLSTLIASGLKPGTLQRRITSISQAHQTAGTANPTQAIQVRLLMEGIRREHGTAQQGKAPVMVEDLRVMVGNLPDNLLGVRDRALLLVGFAGAFRRSELVGLDVTDAEFTRDGLVVTLRKSKTDQEGAGQKVAIPYGSNPDTCPVRALEDWMKAADIKDGALFRSVNRHGRAGVTSLSDKAVALVVKRYAELAGLDASKFAGHSLRAGLATSAAANDVNERAIMKQTRHKSVGMVRRYIRDGSMFKDNAAAQIGL